MEPPAFSSAHRCWRTNFDSLLDFVATGDSITRGNNTGNVSYVNYINTNKLVKEPAVNLGYPSQGIDYLVSQEATRDSYLPASPRRGILCVMIGVNDAISGGMSTSTFLTKLADYLDDARTAGWKVIVCTLLPEGNSTPYIAWRDTVNTEILTWAGVHADRVADTGNDPVMGDRTNCSNTTYYLADKVHPTLLGNQLIADVIRPHIAALAI
jgi:lysophospholipase L1-like esterase